MLGNRGAFVYLLGARGSRKGKLATTSFVICVTQHCVSQSTYLLANISKFCKEKIDFRIILGIFPPRIGLWHEARRDSVNGSQRLKFALAHMFPCVTQCDNLLYWYQLLYTPSYEGIQP